MKLDRNENSTGLGKYALVNQRTRKLEYGFPDDPDEFFVIKLRDKYAQKALLAYAEAAREDGQDEWADEVEGLAKRSGPSSPFCKIPD